MLLRVLYRISKSISFIFMITNIKINNYTLIDSLEVDFQRGFSVITGETGAGKSIILGALSLLLGQRADTNTIKNIEKKCIVEGSFNISGYNLMSFFNNNDIEYDENECILRREISPSGKSRAFINDTPVSITLLRELGIQLVDIHSQHQNSLINSADFQLNVLDIYFIVYIKTSDCVDHNKLWKILQEIGIPDHLICFLRNLYAGQEATFRAGHRATDWFQIGKGVCQDFILSPCLFNLYAEHIM